MNIIIKNNWHDLKIIWYKCSLGDTLPRNLKLIRPMPAGVSCGDVGDFQKRVILDEFENKLP